MVDAIKTPGVPASKHQVARSLLSTAQALYLEAKASAESRFGDSAKAYAKKLEEVAYEVTKSTLEVAGQKVPDEAELDQLLDSIDCRLDGAVGVPLALVDTVKTEVEANVLKVKNFRNETQAFLEARAKSNTSAVLDGMDSIVDYALPSEEDAGSDEGKGASKSDETVDINTKYVRARLSTLRGKVSARLATRALKGLKELRLRSKELVHVDLIEYAETIIDADTVKAAVSDTRERLHKSYTVTQNMVTEAVETVRGEAEAKVLKPAREFYTEAVVTYLKINKEKVDELTAAEFVGAVRARLGDAWEARLVKPTEDVLEFINQEWAEIKSASFVKVSKDGEEQEEFKVDLLVAAVGERLHDAWSKILKSMAAATVDSDGKEAAAAASTDAGSATDDETGAFKDAAEE